MLNFSYQTFLAFVFFYVNVDTLCVNFYLIKINIGWHCQPIYPLSVYSVFSILSLPFFCLLSSVCLSDRQLCFCLSVILIYVYLFGIPPQRVLNELWRTRLSRRRMMWLLAHPLPPLPSAISTGDTQEDWERETTCWQERGVGGAWGGGEAYPDDGEKAWFSINHSILSVLRKWIYPKACHVSTNLFCSHACLLHVLIFFICQSTILHLSVRPAPASVCLPVNLTH